MRLMIFSLIIIGLLAAGLICMPLTGYAGKGDVKSKGKQIYIWHLDEGQGKTVKEANGKGPDGEFVGDIQWVDGVSGSAVLFSGKVGKPQYIAFDGDDHLDITEQLTLAAWISLDAIPTGDQKNKGTIFYKNTYYLQVEPNSGSLAYYFYDTSNPGYHLSKNAVKADGTWHHVAVTWDGTTVRFYIDGEKDPNEIAQKGPGRSTPAKKVFVGGENNACCPRFFQGKIDEITIANYALSQGELRDLMKSALPVDVKGKLATCWAMLKRSYHR
ncbi:TPA: LamG domain-containing protein [Candidatus Poribacteria bacterium]|nr:LamG domain-containing protein [Candidatus Poribacteria bacterium]